MSQQQPNPSSAGFSAGSQLMFATGQYFEGYAGWTGPLAGLAGPGILDPWQGTQTMIEPANGAGTNFPRYYRIDQPSNANAGAGYDGPRTTAVTKINPAAGFTLFHQFILHAAIPAAARVQWALTNDPNSGYVGLDPSGTGSGYFGIACDAADANFQMVRNTSSVGTYTKVNTGLAKTSVGFFAVTLKGPPGGGSMSVQALYLPDASATPQMFANATFTDKLPPSPLFFTWLVQINGTVLHLDTLFSYWFIPFPAPLPSPIG